MREKHLQDVINDTQNDAAAACNAIADVVDYLAVLDMAISSEDDALEPFSQLATVLRGTRELAKKAADAAERTSSALSKELRFEAR